MSFVAVSSTASSVPIELYPQDVDTMPSHHFTQITTLKDIEQHFSEAVHSHWLTIASSLGVSADEIKAIKTKPCSDTQKMSEVMNIWLFKHRENDLPYCLYTLVNILKNVECFNSARNIEFTLSLPGVIPFVKTETDLIDGYFQIDCYDCISYRREWETIARLIKTPLSEIKDIKQRNAGDAINTMMFLELIGFHEQKVRNNEINLSNFHQKLVTALRSKKLDSFIYFESANKLDYKFFLRTGFHTNQFDQFKSLSLPVLTDKVHVPQKIKDFSEITEILDSKVDAKWLEIAFLLDAPIKETEIIYKLHGSDKHKMEQILGVFGKAINNNKFTLFQFLHFLTCVLRHDSINHHDLAKEIESRIAVPKRMAHVVEYNEETSTHQEQWKKVATGLKISHDEISGVNSKGIGDWACMDKIYEIWLKKGAQSQTPLIDMLTQLLSVLRSPDVNCQSAVDVENLISVLRKPSAPLVASAERNCSLKQRDNSTTELSQRHKDTLERIHLKYRVNSFKAKCCKIDVYSFNKLYTLFFEYKLNYNLLGVKLDVPQLNILTYEAESIGPGSTEIRYSRVLGYWTCQPDSNLHQLLDAITTIEILGSNNNPEEYYNYLFVKHDLFSFIKA